MHIQHYEEYTTHHPIPLPLDDFLQRSLDALTQYLAHIQADHPTHHKAYIDQLQLHLQKETVDAPPLPDKVQSRIPDTIHHHITSLSMQHLVHLLDVPDTAWDGDAPVMVITENFHRARFIPPYIRLDILTQLLPQPAAIQWFRDYTDQRIAQVVQPIPDLDTLTQLRDGQLQGNIHGQDMYWTQAILGDHQYVNKVTRCKIHDVLRDGYDPQLMEVVACDPDYAMFRAINPHFRMTRTQTLFSGGCCDTCYHDVRHVTPDHPDAAFFHTL